MGGFQTRPYRTHNIKIIVDLALFVAMPNHIHGIVVIVNSSANAVPHVGADNYSLLPVHRAVFYGALKQR
jgi:ribose 1,5-bisphosphokinase PhnN